MSRLELTEEEQREIIERIKDSTPDVSCPMCGHGEFQIHHTVGALKAQEATASSGQSIGLILSVCQNCGYTLTYSADFFGYPK